MTSKIFLDLDEFLKLKSAKQTALFIANKKNKFLILAHLFKNYLKVFPKTYIEDFFHNKELFYVKNAPIINVLIKLLRMVELNDNEMFKLNNIFSIKEMQQIIEKYIYIENKIIKNNSKKALQLANKNQTLLNLKQSVLNNQLDVYSKRLKLRSFL